MREVSQDAKTNVIPSKQAIEKMRTILGQLETLHHQAGHPDRDTMAEKWPGIWKQMKHYESKAFGKLTNTILCNMDKWAYWYELLYTRWLEEQFPDKNTKRATSVQTPGYKIKTIKTKALKDYEAKKRKSLDKQKTFL